MKYSDLRKKYGDHVYQLLSHFKSVEIYTYETKTESTYQLTILAYPHKIDAEKTEMIDILTGMRYQMLDRSKNIFPNIGENCYRSTGVRNIDQHLFDLISNYEDEMKAGVNYDLEHFDDVIRRMQNFVITTDGFTKLDQFQHIALTPEEMEQKNKERLIKNNVHDFYHIFCAKIVGVSSADISIRKRRKNKIRWYLSEENVPVMMINDGKQAVDLLSDGSKIYERVELIVKESKFPFQKTFAEMTDQQYDRIMERLLAGEDAFYILEDPDMFQSRLFTYAQVQCIYDNYRKVCQEQQKQKPKQLTQIKK